MKIKPIFILIISLLFLSCDNDDDSSNSTFVLKTQQEVNDFGSQNHTIIGGLIIGPEELYSNLEPIVDLSPINGLVQTQDIIIRNNQQLSSLNGLESINSVNGDFTIHDNTTNNYCAIQSLVEENGIGGELQIYYNFYNPDVEELIEKCHYSQGGNYVLSTQEDVEELGQKSYSNLLDLTLNGSAVDPITDLIPLNTIKQVRALTVRDQTSLVTLEGLDLIEARNISIRNNAILENIDAIADATMVYDISMSSFHGNIVIEDNSQLLSINGFDNILATRDFIVKNNASLQNIDGFTNLQEVRNWFHIGYNQSLTSILGFNSMTYTEKYVRINFNNSLEEISGFEELNTIDRDLEISDNPSLQTIPLFNNLEYTSSLTISSNLNLISFSGFENLIQISALTISNNQNLQEIPPFNSHFEAISNCGGDGGGGIFITNNDSLIEINGFLNLQNNDNFICNIIIYDNTSLQSITGFSNVYDILSLEIKNNTNLTTINGFNLFERNADFNISGNSSISNITAFENLEEINYYIIFSDTNLSSLDFFNSLQTLPVISFAITNNSSLTDFCSLVAAVQSNFQPAYYDVYDNAYNPTRQNLIDGDCSL